MPVVVDVGGGQSYQRLPWAGEVWEDFQGERADCLPGFGRLEKTCQGKEEGRKYTALATVLESVMAYGLI